MIEIHKSVCSPQFLPKLFPRNHLSRVFQEVGQHLERLFLQSYPDAVLAQFAEPQPDTSRPRICDRLGGPWSSGSTLRNGRIWAELSGDGAGAPDGMKIDSEGNLYCCGPGGIHVLDQSAAALGVIRVPSPVANFTWGDDDLKSLFITATDNLYRIRVRVPGQSGALAGI